MVAVCAIPVSLNCISSSSEQSIYFAGSFNELPLHSPAYLCLLYWFYHYAADRNLAAEPEAGVLLLPISGRNSPQHAPAQRCLNKALGTI